MLVVEGGPSSSANNPANSVARGDARTDDEKDVVDELDCFMRPKNSPAIKPDVARRSKPRLIATPVFAEDEDEDADESPLPLFVPGVEDVAVVDVVGDAVAAFSNARYSLPFESVTSGWLPKLDESQFDKMEIEMCDDAPKSDVTDGSLLRLFVASPLLVSWFRIKLETESEGNVS